MFEGAQGALLDIDHGTYPFVTSSSTTAGGTATGSGFGTTRVGFGPFPTELFDEVGKALSERGQEVGATTGRARRCGWFDAVNLRRVVEVGSISGLCLTKLDVLDSLPTLRLCVAYEDENGRPVEAPTDADSYLGLKPVYEELPGWQQSTQGIKHLKDLPSNARAYIKRVSTGPDRSETIILRHPFG